MVVERLSDDDWMVREAASKALGAIGCGTGGQVVGVMLGQVLRGANQRAKLAAVEACTLMGESSGCNADLVANLIIENESEWATSAAYDALSRMGARGAVHGKIVMSRGFHDPDLKDREMAVKCIVGMREHSGCFIEALVDHFEDESVMVRCCAAKALSLQNRSVAERNAAYLVLGLEDDEWRMRLASLEGLAHMSRNWDGDRSWDGLGETDAMWIMSSAALLWDEAWDVRQRAQEVAIEMMRKEKLSAHQLALLQIVTYKPKPGEEPPSAWPECPLSKFVATGLDSENLWTRLNCIEAIGALGVMCAEYAHKFGQMQHDSDWRIAEAVKVGLLAMGDAGEFEMMRQNEALDRFLKIKQDIKDRDDCRRMLRVLESNMQAAVMAEMRIRNEAYDTAKELERRQNEAMGIVNHTSVLIHN